MNRLHFDKVVGVDDIFDLSSFLDLDLEGNHVFLVDENAVRNDLFEGRGAVKKCQKDGVASRDGIKVFADEPLAADRGLVTYLEC